MKATKGFVLITALLLFTASTLLGAEKPEVIGVGKCKACHKSKTKGDQYGKWQASPHAKAFETLKNEHSAEIAKKMGIKDASKDEKCLKCHITALKGDKGKDITDEGVGCESCHGPGSLYKSSHKKDKAKALTEGLIEPNEKSCLVCHNEESPTYKKFVFADAVKEIAHPNPTKKK